MMFLIGENMQINGFDQLNIPADSFDAEKYIESYFDTMRISEEEKETRRQAARDFREYLLTLFLLLGIQSEYLAVNWNIIESEMRTEFERAALRYASNTQMLRDYIANKTSEFVETTRENIDKGDYWLSDERATYEAVNEANDVLALEEYQKAIEEGKTHKVWKTERDRRVRKTHRVMDGVKIPITDMFEVGNGFMRFAHDWYYLPEECYNCRCSTEYVGGRRKEDKISQSSEKPYEIHSRAKTIRTEEDLRSISNSSIIKMNSMEEIVGYFKNTYGINVEEFVDTPERLFLNKAPLAGIDDMLTEFPEIKNLLKTVRYSPHLGDMGDSSTAGVIRIGKYGLKDYGTGVHEAAHILDYVRDPFRRGYADSVVEMARKNLKLRENSKEYKNMITQIVVDTKALNDYKEVFAYSIETAKGGVNVSLSNEIYRIVKEGIK